MKRAEANEGLAFHAQGGAHTRQCKHQAVCSHRTSLVILAGVWGLALASKEASRGKRRLGGSHTRRCKLKAVHTQGGAHTGCRRPLQESFCLRGGAGAGPRIGPSQLVVERSEPRQGKGLAFHTQSNAHNRRFVATARVCLLKRGCGGWSLRRVKGTEAREGSAVYTQGGAHKRRSVATARVLLCKRGCGAWPPWRPKQAEAREGLAVHTQGGSHTRRCTHLRFVATAGVLLLKRGCGWWPPRRAKRAEAREGLAVHTQGGAHTRRSVAIVGVLLLKRGGGGWPPSRAKRRCLSCEAK